MVNWCAIGLAIAVIYILPKRLIAKKIINYYKYRALNVPPRTVIVIIDEIGFNYQKARNYAGKGARIIIAGKDKSKIESARKALIRSTKNKNIVTVHVNRHDRTSLNRFAEQIADNEVTVDSIINNSGEELSDLDIIFKTQELDKERFQNHCLNFFYSRLPDNDL